MNCHELDELLTPYLLGDLEEDRSEQVRGHLETCAGCRASKDELASTLGLLRDAMVADDFAPARLDAHRRRRVRLGRKPLPLIWLMEYQRPLALAASVVISLGILGAVLVPSLHRARPKATSHSMDFAMAEKQSIQLEELREIQSLERSSEALTENYYSVHKLAKEPADMPAPDLKPAESEMDLSALDINGDASSPLVMRGLYSGRAEAGRAGARRESVESGETVDVITTANLKRSDDVVVFYNDGNSIAGGLSPDKPTGESELSKSTADLTVAMRKPATPKAPRPTVKPKAALEKQIETGSGSLVSRYDHAASRDPFGEVPAEEGGFAYGGKAMKPSVPQPTPRDPFEGAAKDHGRVVAAGEPVARAAEAAAKTEKMVPLHIELPKPQFAGTPVPIRPQNLETSIGGDRKSGPVDEDEKKIVKHDLPSVEMLDAAELANGTFAWTERDSAGNGDIARSYTYEIQPGDTLSSIAERERTSVEELARLNKVQDPNRIQAGYTLNLPDSSARPSDTGRKHASELTWRSHSKVAEKTLPQSQQDIHWGTVADTSDSMPDEPMIVASVPAPEPAMPGLETTARKKRETNGRASSRAPIKEALPQRTATRATDLETKLDKTVLPKLDFRDSDIQDVMQYLEDATKAADPEGKGMDVVLNLGLPGNTEAMTAPAPDDADEFFDDEPMFEDLLGPQGTTTESSESPVLGSTPRITLDLEQVSAKDALRYITEVANLKYRVEGDKVIVSPEGVVMGRVITKIYPAQPSIMDAIVDVAKKDTTDREDDDFIEIGARGTTLAKADPKEFFVKAGVPFPIGTSVTYNPSVNGFIVANTPENLEAFESTLDQLKALPAEEEEAKPVFKAAGFNPYVETARNPFSTFSIDVDTAAYTLARRYMLNGALPPAEAVRTEEFVNFFDYDYRPPSSGTFAVYTEYAPSPFGQGYLLKIGVKGKRLGREEQRRSVLTFVIDTSGSMNTPDRLGLLKDSLRLLVDELDPADQVAIVQYGSQARLILDHTPAGSKKAVLTAIDRLQASGSTHLEEGLRLGYEQAAKAFLGGADNRVLLLSDGMANLGSADAEEILSSVEAYRRQGIFCSVFGFGLGTYNDELLETLANKGDGVYQFIDSEQESRRVFVDDLAATLNVIAKDVKIQVEFNPRRVHRYRQIGYENRQLAKEDFRNDAVDAGEVGSGQSVTALYEVDPRGAEGEPLGTVRIRYQDIRTGEYEEIEKRIDSTGYMPSVERANVRFKLAASVAEFAEILRGSPFATDSDYEGVAKQLRPVALELSLDQRVQELLRLVHSAGSLPRAAE